MLGGCGESPRQPQGAIAKHADPAPAAIALKTIPSASDAIPWSSSGPSGVPEVLVRFTLSVVDEASRLIQGAHIFEVDFEKDPSTRWDERVTFHGTTDGAGQLSISWGSRLHGIVVRADGYAIWFASALTESTVALRKGYPVRVRVPPGAVPHFPLGLRACAEKRAFPGLPGDVATLAKGSLPCSVIDANGQALLTLPAVGSYNIFLEVEIDQSLFYSAHSTRSSRLYKPPRPEVQVEGDVEIGMDIAVDVDELANASAPLLEEAKRKQEYRAQADSRRAASRPR